MTLNSKEIKLLDRIKEDPSYNNWFFRQVKHLKWFYPLKNQGYFSPSNIKLDKDNNTYFWNVLDYLERVSIQVKEKSIENKVYAIELLKIIDETVVVSKKRKEQIGKSINNYHIWWYCVKILNNIPFDFIVANLSIEQFKTWLLEWTNPELSGDLTISDIGEKLLPKFLDNKDTVQFAEVIIEIITTVKAGGKKDPFTKRENAILTYSSYWILDAFKKNSQKIGEVCSISVIYDFANKLRSALEYEHNDYHVNIKINSDIYQIQVARVQKQDLKPGEIGFKENFYNTTIKRFDPEQLKDIDIEKDFWTLHNTKPQIELKRFPFEATEKKVFIERIKENLTLEIDWQKVEDLEKKLNDLFDGLYEDYSQIWFKSLAIGGSDHANRIEEVLTIILRDVLLAKCESNRGEGRLIVEKFISDQYRFPIFKKCALLCIDKYWKDYAELFDKFLKIIPDVLEQSDFEVELHDILQNHNRQFNRGIIDKFNELIEKVPDYYRKEGKKLEAYWRYKWLSPFKDNPDFSNLYNDAKTQAEVKEDKAYEPERSTFKGGFVVHKPPLSKGEILSKPTAELVKFVKEFQGADFWDGTFEGKPDKEGLCDILQAAAREDPGKFTNEIELFLSDGLYSYNYHIFRGFLDAWNNGRSLNWEKIFTFSLGYIKRDNFYTEALKEQRGDSGKGKYIWFVDAIADLIEKGSIKDEWAFSEEHFSKVDEIFDRLLPFLKSEKHPDTQRDAATYALNTTLGRVIIAFIIFSLRVARATQKKEEKWGDNKYEKFFDKGIEAYIWFGRYIPNIRYLDPEYVDNKIKNLSEREADNYEWQMFMEGYLTCSYAYEEIYNLMRINYYKAIKDKVFEEHVDNRLVQHITIGYLRGYELLKEDNDNGAESLFWKMLDEGGFPEKRDRWLETVSFFWSISGRSIRKNEKEEISEDFKKKILAFWKWTYECRLDVQKKLSDDYPSFLGRLAELTILLDKIDDRAYEWLMLSTPYIDLHHNSAFFFEYLTKFEDEESIRRIGAIFLEALKHTTPTFRQEDLQLIVERIYKIGKSDPKIKKIADDICNIYGRRGIHFLKDLFYKHQNRNREALP